MAERFELVERLGKGGMGVVWKARDAATGGFVAVKLIHDIYSDDPDYVARFEREVDVARRIDSANVVRVLGYGRRESVPFMVMEYVEGKSLRDVVKERGRLPWPEVLEIAAQLAAALEAAHAAGVIHRDVKPSNVLVTADGTVKLADFGIARALDATRLTGSSTMLGTPAYMSPDADVTPRSDLYSLGCVLYEALTGAPPFVGETQQQVVLKHVRQQPDLSRIADPEARRIIGALLEKDETHRPASAAALGAMLGAASGPKAPPKRRVVRRSPLRSRDWARRLAKGLVIGDRFELCDFIESDELSTVWRGIDRNDGEPVAVKLLLEPFPDDIDVWLREASSAATVDSPNISWVLASGRTSRGQPFVVTEWIEGSTLAGKLHRGGPMTWEELRPILGSVADGLAALHRAGATFGAVKPTNIVLGRDEPPCLVGLWHDFADGQLPPEADHTPLGAAGDVYSLGQTVYRALTGQTGEADYWAMPAEARDLVMALVRDEPDRRIPASAIGPVLRGEMKPLPGHRTHRKSKLATAFLLVPVALLLGLYWLSFLIRRLS